MNAIAPPLAPAAPSVQQSNRAGFKAYVRDKATEAVLREALGDLAQDDASIRRADLEAMRQLLRRNTAPDVLILDVSGEAEPLRVLDDLAQFVEPGARVLAIGDAQDAEFYRQATRTLGIVEYLPKPLNREMVARYFRPVIVGQDPAELDLRAGRIIAVTGARGGVGATTVAANLASHLGEATRRHTLLLDADLNGGTAALMLSAEAGDALRIALEYPEKVDEVFLQRAVRAVTDRLHILSAEEGLDRIAAARPEAALELLARLRQRYAFIVIDVPRFITPLNRVFLDAAHQRVLVIDGSLASVRDTLRFMALPNSPAQSRPPIIVLNHAGHAGMLPYKQVIAAIGRTPEVTIGHAPSLLSRAATLGTPARRNRRGPMRQAMEQLSREITVAAGRRGPAEGRGLFARLFGAPAYRPWSPAR